MFWEHERYYGLGMDSLVTVCSRNTNVIMVWAWMIWLLYALGTRTLLWFGHGCCSERMLLEHPRYYVLGMDALVSACSWYTNVIMVWAWMLRLSSAVAHRQTQCVVYAVFRARGTPRMCGSSHAGHIRRGRPSMVLLRVYAPAEPITIILNVPTLGFKRMLKQNDQLPRD